MKFRVFTVSMFCLASCSSEGEYRVIGDVPAKKATPIPEYPKKMNNDFDDEFQFFFTANSLEEENYGNWIRERAEFEYKRLQKNGASTLPKEEYFPTRPFAFEYIEPLLNSPEGKPTKAPPSQEELKGHVDKVLNVMKGNCPAFFPEARWPKLTIQWGQEVERNLIGYVLPQFNWGYLSQKPTYRWRDDLPLTIFAWNRRANDTMASTRTTFVDINGYEFWESKKSLTDRSFKFWFYPEKGSYFDSKLAHEISHSVHMGWWFATGKRLDITRTFMESTAEWMKGLCYNNELTQDRVQEWFDRTTQDLIDIGEGRSDDSWPYSTGMIDFTKNLDAYSSVYPLGTLLGVLRMQGDPRGDTRYLAEKTIEAWNQMEVTPLNCLGKYCAGHLLHSNPQIRPYMFKFSVFLRKFEEVIGGVPPEYKGMFDHFVRAIAKKEHE